MKEKGFTIIEVVLVLGIAGLIFMMVFVALPTLQRNGRDTQRREDLTSFINAIKKYQGNNRGALPATTNALTTVTSVDIPDAAANSWAGFYRDYLPNPFNDPSGSVYGLMAAMCNASSVGGQCTGAAYNMIENIKDDSTKGFINVIVQATCNGQDIVGSSNPRKFAVLYKLEGGGIYCGND